MLKVHRATTRASRRRSMRSTCDGARLERARDCLQVPAPIAELMHGFFADSDAAGELDFMRRRRRLPRAISGSSWRRCRRRERRAPRCLLSVVDRTVEVQAERTLARRDAARQPDRPAQPPGLHRGDREGRREGRPRPRTCGAGRRHAALQPDQRIDGQPGRRRAADHLRPPADLGACAPATCWRAPAATSSASWSSLRRGVEDALAAAERIQQVMADAVQAVASSRSASNARSASR